MSKVTPRPRARLSLRKRLALFKKMGERIEQLPPVEPALPGESRGWTREDLYAERLERYARSRQR